jgi:hypothetical protein
MNRRALIIANSLYDDQRFAPLPAAASDAIALADVLADRAIGGFSVESVLNAGQRAVMRAIESFFSRAKHDELLVLHLSLHGWKDIHNRLYFIVADTEHGLMGSTAVSANFVSDCMSQSRSTRVIVLLDCCYSGAFVAAMRRRATGPPQVDVSETFEGKGRVVLTASTSLQFAHETEPGVLSSRERARPSVFTSAIVQGLKDGSADLDQDGLVSISELYDYIHAALRENAPGQVPTLSVDSARGTIYLAHSPRRAITRNVDAVLGADNQAPHRRVLGNDSSAQNTRLPNGEPTLTWRNREYGLLHLTRRNQKAFLAELRKDGVRKVWAWPENVESGSGNGPDKVVVRFQNASDEPIYAVRVAVGSNWISETIKYAELSVGNVIAPHFDSQYVVEIRLDRVNGNLEMSPPVEILFCDATGGRFWHRDRFGGINDIAAGPPPSGGEYFFTNLR